MRTALRLAALCLLPLLSCSDPSQVRSAADAPQLPPAPASAEAAAKAVLGQKYAVDQVGFSFTWFDKDSIAWEGMTKDTSKFYRDQLSALRSLRLEFGTDSTLRFIQKEQSNPATWKVQQDTNSANKDLRITYLSKEFNFGNDTTPQLVTQTYPVRGLNERFLFIESPFELNRRKVVLLMSRQ